MGRSRADSATLGPEFSLIVTCQQQVWAIDGEPKVQGFMAWARAELLG